MSFMWLDSYTQMWSLWNGCSAKCASAGCTKIVRDATNTMMSHSTVDAQMRMTAQGTTPFS